MKAGTKVLSMEHLEEDSDDSEGLNRSMQIERMFSGSPMVVDPLPRRSQTLKTNLEKGAAINSTRKMNKVAALINTPMKNSEGEEESCSDFSRMSRA